MTSFGSKQLTSHIVASHAWSVFTCTRTRCTVVPGQCKSFSPSTCWWLAHRLSTTVLTVLTHSAVLLAWYSVCSHLTHSLQCHSFIVLGSVVISKTQVGPLDSNSHLLGSNECIIHCQTGLLGCSAFEGNTWSSVVLRFSRGHSLFLVSGRCPLMQQRTILAETCVKSFV